MEKIEEARKLLRGIAKYSNDPASRDEAERALKLLKDPLRNPALPVGVVVACVSWAVVGFVFGKEW